MIPTKKMNIPYITEPIVARKSKKCSLFIAAFSSSERPNKKQKKFQSIIFICTLLEGKKSKVKLEWILA